MAGSGAGQAFEDMAVLTALFAHVQSKEQIPKAFRAYDLTRRARAQMTVRLAKDMLMNSTFQLPGVNNGNIVERLHGMLHSVTGRDIDDQNREAVKLFCEA
jgi:salicylate hydroxylase